MLPRPVRADTFAVVELHPPPEGSGVGVGDGGAVVAATAVAVDGTLVAVGVGGTGVAVGGTAVAVGGTAVAVGGAAVAVGVGGTRVGVGVGTSTNIRSKSLFTLPLRYMSVVLDLVPFRKNSMGCPRSARSPGSTTRFLYSSPTMAAGRDSIDPIRATISAPSGTAPPATTISPE